MRGRGGAMPGYMLLGQESVQKELKLTDEQKQDVKQFAEKLRGEMQGLRDLDPSEQESKRRELAGNAEKEIGKILHPDQAKRLHQIGLQLQGAMALNNPKVAEELQLTSEQKEKVKDMQQQMQKQMEDLRQAGGSQEENREKIAEMRKSAASKAQEMLTPEQQTKWKEMTGEPFTGKIQMMGRPGGGH
jgi:hypothetical protein